MPGTILDIWGYSDKQDNSRPIMEFYDEPYKNKYTISFPFQENFHDYKLFKKVYFINSIQKLILIINTQYVQPEGHSC